MIYLFTALYCEAQIFIKQFRLEKDLQSTRFQEFYNETAGIRLTITGIGEIAAAAAVGSVCAEHKPKEGDMLLNIGTCAHTSGSGGVFLCNKITEQATGKTFYPDILYRHNFCEEAIVTGMRLWDREKTGERGARPWDAEEAPLSKTEFRVGEKNNAELPAAYSAGVLYDMEAAAIYQAGSYFFGPHQMLFLKVVSDGGTPEAVTNIQIEHLMETHQDVLFDFVERLHMIALNNMRKADCLRQEREALVAKLCSDMHCSKTMENSLEQHIRYLELTGTDYVSEIQGMYRAGLLPCKDKKEGKLRFEELKRRLF